MSEASFNTSLRLHVKMVGEAHRESGDITGSEQEFDHSQTILRSLPLPTP